MSDATDKAANEMIVALWARIGFIRQRGLPWQRKDAALLQDAAECIQALRAGYETSQLTIALLQGRAQKFELIAEIVDGRRT